MRTASDIVWSSCGAPKVDECLDVPVNECWVCGGSAQRSLPREHWMGAQFTGQNRIKASWSNRVCEPCMFVMSANSPVPGRPPKEGSKHGGRFCNYSHLWEAGGTYSNASKGEKSIIRDFLRCEHPERWFAAIAESGQKHVLPWTPINSSGRCGLVLFDEQIVKVPPTLILVDDMTAILTAGVTKEEGLSGDYSTRSWEKCAEKIKEFEEEHGSKQRNGGWFKLAIWLAQRDEEATRQRIEKEKEAKARKDADLKRNKPRPKNMYSECHHGATLGVSGGRSKSIEALGPIAVAPDDSNTHVGKRRRMGDGNSKKPTTRGPKQLTLFCD
jgi:hypothetical protein